MPRAKGLNLFDVFLHSGKDVKSSAVTTVVATVQRKAPTNTLHSNAARWNEVLTPKTFIVRKKKPKKISILKKKILMVGKIEAMLGSLTIVCMLSSDILGTSSL